jgi:hypothetical protein
MDAYAKQHPLARYDRLGCFRASLLPSKSTSYGIACAMPRRTTFDPLFGDLEQT